MHLIMLHCETSLECSHSWICFCFLHDNFFTIYASLCVNFICTLYPNCSLVAALHIERKRCLTSGCCESHLKDAASNWNETQARMRHPWEASWQWSDKLHFLILSFNWFIPSQNSRSHYTDNQQQPALSLTQSFTHPVALLDPRLYRWLWPRLIGYAKSLGDM